MREASRPCRIGSNGRAERRRQPWSGWIGSVPAQVRVSCAPTGRTLASGMNDRMGVRTELDARPPRDGGDGAIRIGSDAHKELFCRMLLDTFNPYKPAIIDWPKLTPRRARPAGEPADLGHRRADRGQSQAARADLCRADRRTRCSRRRSSSMASRRAGTSGCCPTWSQAYGIVLGARAANTLDAARSGMGLHGDGLQRVHRQLLRLRPLRARQALGFLPAGAGRHLRAGHAGRRPPHPLLRQLGGLAPAQHCRGGAGRFSSPRSSGSGLVSFGSGSRRRAMSAVTILPLPVINRWGWKSTPAASWRSASPRTTGGWRATTRGSRVPA